MFVAIYEDYINVYQCYQYIFVYAATNSIIPSAVKRDTFFSSVQYVHDVYSMLALALSKPARLNRSSGLIRNSYPLNK
jgi:hypothetical protein